MSKEYWVQMCSLGERLREERERLDFNQEQLGAIGGVNRNSQGKYEKGDRQPDAAYLAAVAEKGVDVLYVLTGQRSTSEAGLAPDEAALMDNYRHSTEADRQSLRSVGNAFAKSRLMDDDAEVGGN